MILFFMLKFCLVTTSIFGKKVFKLGSMCKSCICSFIHNLKGGFPGLKVITRGAVDKMYVTHANINHGYHFDLTSHIVARTGSSKNA